MLKRVLAGNGQVLLCGTCMDARGLAEAEIDSRARAQHHGRTRDRDRRRRQGPGVLSASRNSCPIYLDYNASTPIDPAVAAAMRPFLEERFGNPSSDHWAERAGEGRARAGARPGRRAAGRGAGRDRVHERRQRGQQPRPQGRVLRAEAARATTSSPRAIEHPAVLEPCRFLERLGVRVTYLPVDGTGRVDPDDVRRAITPRTILVSIMHANNEVGTIQPIAEIERASRASTASACTPTRRNRSARSRPTSTTLGVDLLTIAGHKLYAPKGVGALYVRRGIALEPLIHGAGHEGGRRAGTESALLAVGLGVGLRPRHADLAAMECVRALRDRFWDGAAGPVRRRRRPQRPPGAAPAQHAQRVVRRSHWRGSPRTDRGHCRLDGLGLSCRRDHVVSGPEGHAGSARDWHGCHPIQPRARHYAGRH